MNHLRLLSSLLTLSAPPKRFCVKSDAAHPRQSQQHSVTAQCKLAIMSKINLYKDQWAVELKWFASIVTQVNETICKWIASLSYRQIYACTQWRILSTSLWGHCVVFIPWRFTRTLTAPSLSQSGRNSNLGNIRTLWLALLPPSNMVLVPSLSASCVLFGLSMFSPIQSKNMQVRWTGNCECVNVCIH